MSITTGTAGWAGADWLRENGKVVSDFGARAADLLGWWQRGIYHMDRDALRADWSTPNWVTLTVHCGGWATFDGGDLTRLVVGAHDRAIRVELEPVAPRLMRLWLHPRRRDGEHFARHPSLEDAARAHRAAEA